MRKELALMAATIGGAVLVLPILVEGGQWWWRIVARFFAGQ